MEIASETLFDERIPPFGRELHDNYRSTVYACQNFRLQAGLQPPEAQRFLRLNGWQSYTFVTAWNPFSLRQRSLVENQRSNDSLRRELRRRDLPFLPAQASDVAGLWPPEAGCFIFDLPLADSLSLGLRFGQNAIVYGTLTSPPEVLWCHGRLS